MITQNQVTHAYRAFGRSSLGPWLNPGVGPALTTCHAYHRTSRCRPHNQAQKKEARYKAPVAIMSKPAPHLAMIPATRSEGGAVRVQEYNTTNMRVTEVRNAARQRRQTGSGHKNQVPGRVLYTTQRITEPLSEN